MSPPFASTSSTCGLGFRCPTLWTASLGALAPWFYSGSSARANESRQVWFIFLLQFCWGFRRLEKTWSSPRVRRPLDHAFVEVVHIVMTVLIFSNSWYLMLYLPHHIILCIFLISNPEDFLWVSGCQSCCKIIERCWSLGMERTMTSLDQFDQGFYQGQGSACGCSTSAGQEFSILITPMPTILIQHGSRCEDHRGISYGELFRKCPEGKFWQVLASFVSSIRVATCMMCWWFCIFWY